MRSRESSWGGISLGSELGLRGHTGHTHLHVCDLWQATSLVWALVSAAGGRGVVLLPPLWSLSQSHQNLVGCRGPASGTPWVPSEDSSWQDVADILVDVVAASLVCVEGVCVCPRVRLGRGGGAACQSPSLGRESRSSRPCCESPRFARATSWRHLEGREGVGLAWCCPPPGHSPFKGAGAAWGLGRPCCGISTRALPSDTTRARDLKSEASPLPGHSSP